MQVTSFLQDESSSNMQIIVISLKEEFFSKADALLGVYSVVTNLFTLTLTRAIDGVRLPRSDGSPFLQYEDCMVSHILTLDLRPYPLPEEDREKQARVARVRPV